MIKKSFIFFSLMVLMVTLSACGFHLRQSHIHLGAKYPTVILPYSSTHTFHQSLHRALVAASIHVLEEPPPDTSYPKLIVRSQHLAQQPLVYGPDSELRRERLRMTVAFSFDADQFEIFTERDRQLNSNQTLGDNAEKVLIEQEMQADIIDQLLRYLEANNATLP